MKTINNLTELVLDTKLKLNPQTQEFISLSQLGDDWSVQKYRNQVWVCVLDKTNVWRGHLPVINESLPIIQNRFLLK